MNDHSAFNTAGYSSDQETESYLRKAALPGLSSYTSVQATMPSNRGKPKAIAVANMATWLKWNPT